MDSPEYIRCGHLNDVGQICREMVKIGKFCSECGNKAAPPPADERRCPACSSLVKPTARFCGECGGIIPGAQLTPKSYSPFQPVHRPQPQYAVGPISYPPSPYSPQGSRSPSPMPRQSPRDTPTGQNPSIPAHVPGHHLQNIATHPHSYSPSSQFQYQGQSQGQFLGQVQGPQHQTEDGYLRPQPHYRGQDPLGGESQDSLYATVPDPIRDSVQPGISQAGGEGLYMRMDGAPRQPTGIHVSRVYHSQSEPQPGPSNAPPQHSSGASIQMTPKPRPVAKPRTLPKKPVLRPQPSSTPTTTPTQASISNPQPQPQPQTHIPSITTSEVDNVYENISYKKQPANPASKRCDETNPESPSLPAETESNYVNVPVEGKDGGSEIRGDNQPNLRPPKPGSESRQSTSLSSPTPSSTSSLTTSSPSSPLPSPFTLSPPSHTSPTTQQHSTPPNPDLRPPTPSAPRLSSLEHEGDPRITSNESRPVPQTSPDTNTTLATGNRQQPSRQDTLTGGGIHTTPGSKGSPAHRSTITMVLRNNQDPIPKGQEQKSHQGENLIGTGQRLSSALQKNLDALTQDKDTSASNAPDVSNDGGGQADDKDIAPPLPPKPKLPHLNPSSGTPPPLEPRNTLSAGTPRNDNLPKGSLYPKLPSAEEIEAETEESNKTLTSQDWETDENKDVDTSYDDHSLPPGSDAGFRQETVGQNLMSSVGNGFVEEDADGWTTVTRRRGHKSGMRKIFINFHVILHADFNPANRQCTVYLVYRVDNRPLRHIEMVQNSRENSVPDGSMLMTGVLEMDEYAADKMLFYHYEVDTHGYYRRDQWQHRDRMLMIKTSQILGGYIHQYDGFIMAKPVSKSMWNDSTKEKDMLVQALKEMMPSWFNFKGQDHIHQIRRLVRSTEEWPLLDSGNHQKDKKRALFHEALHVHIKQAIHMVMLKETEYEERHDDGLDRLALAITVTVMDKQHALRLDVNDINKIFDFFLVKADPQQKSCSELESLTNRHFPFENFDLAQYVWDFIIKYYRLTTNTLQCVCAIPMWHFLKKLCRPYIIPHVLNKPDHETTGWWGVNDINKELDIMKKQIKKAAPRDISEMLAKTKHLFTLDWLLPRTFLAFLSLCHLPAVVNDPDVPIDALIAMVSYHAKLDPYYLLRDQVKDALAKLRNRIKAYTLNGAADRSQRISPRKEGQMLYVSIKAVVDLLIHIIPYTKVHPYDEQMVLLIVEQQSMLSQALSQNEEEMKSPKLSEAVAREFRDFLGLTMGWFTMWKNELQRDRYLKTKDCRDREIQVWNQLLSTHMWCPSGSSWYESILHDLKQHTQRMSALEVLGIYQFQVKEGQQHKALVEHFTMAALRAAEKEMRDTGGSNLFNHGLTYDILSDVLWKCWPEYQGEKILDERVVLEHILNLEALHRFIPVIDKCTNECQTLLKVSVTVINNQVLGLRSGNITMGNLNYISIYKDSFLRLVEASSGRREFNERALHTLIHVLSGHAEDFNNARDMVRCFVEFSRKLEKVAHHPCHEKAETETDNILLKEIKPANAKQKGSTHLITSYFNLHQDMVQPLQGLPQLKDSITFLHSWIECGRETSQINLEQKQDDTLTMDDLGKLVWPTALQKWNLTKEKLLKLDLSFEECEELFFNLNEDSIRKELHFVMPNQGKEEVEKRLDVIRKCRKLSLQRKSATAVLEAKEAMGLTGDFKTVAQVANMGSSKLSKMKRIISDAGVMLSRMEEQHIQSIEAVTRSFELVKWIRTYIPTLDQLKIFVDLALIAASEQGSLEITTVQSLQDAVRGFAPLIYDLRQTADYHEFNKKCREIWDSDFDIADITKNMRDSYSQLNWLNEVQVTQGKMQVNTLQQVDFINRYGVFIVGSNGANNSKNKLLEDIIHVELPNTEGDLEAKKNYTYQELRELHSRLMLVAGKAEQGNDSVDRFVEIFDGVTGLGETFLTICTAGSILFQDWSAKFFCRDPHHEQNDDESYVNAFIDFGLSDKKLAGRASDASIIQQINQIREFMETCLREWRSYVDTKRQEYPELNHFSIEQLVTMRSELARFTSRKITPSHQVLVLLHDVRNNCTVADLQQALRVATEEIKAKGQARLHHAGAADAGRAGYVPAPDEHPNIALLLEEGFSWRTVQHVVEIYGKENFDELEWRCQEREEEEKEQVDNNGNNETNFRVLQSDQSLAHMADEFLHQLLKQQTKLKDQLKALWDKYLASATLSLENYLSVEHLGIVLKCLSNRADLKRELPTYITEGQPNLIVCPAVEMFLTILSLYMESPDQPKPRRDEVLLCTEDTGLEEVELLFWRAKQDKTGRIYTLGDADKMSYDVACRVEEVIESRLQGEAQYRLVIICSSENQDRAFLVASLDHNRVSDVKPKEVREVQVYVKRHLTVRRDGHIDPDNCSMRIVRSKNAGNGKSMWMRRQKGKMMKGNRGVAHSLPLHGRTADAKALLSRLLVYTLPPSDTTPRLFHIDVPHEMNQGVDHLLFNLIILGSLSDTEGYIWHRSGNDFYAIELMPLRNWEIGIIEPEEVAEKRVHKVLDLLPTVNCLSPAESLQRMKAPGQNDGYEQLMDEEEYRSVPLQRVYQYLKRHSTDAPFKAINAKRPEDTPAQCLDLLLKLCGLQNPSWAELSYFIHFLNVQLESCEKSAFVSEAAEEAAFPGFIKFVVRFMIQMSKDFASRSLEMAEESPMNQPKAQRAVRNEISQYQLKRRWESSPHPYIFFNPDGVSLTFLGFKITVPDMNIVDPETNKILEKNSMIQELHTQLKHNGIQLDEDFNGLKREQKLERLYKVMHNDVILDPITGKIKDPDPRYVLTSDNVKKMLAIHMRFRCGIPVIVMGETGCGKTNLIKFLCQLQTPQVTQHPQQNNPQAPLSPAGSKSAVQNIVAGPPKPPKPRKPMRNMMLMKVHGGTRKEDILEKIKKSEAMARQNRKEVPGLMTILFLDEVNTTEALGLVKEVLCDRTVDGKPLMPQSGLQIVAACNPYRKHSEETIKMLEKAGLGYHVHAEKTVDLLGRIPMRQLVYRVQPLPQSMLPFVWDFGQLDLKTEKLYITEIVRKKLEQLCEALPNIPIEFTDILVSAQNFMRQQKDECSFVSLRDVERTMNVMEWFFRKRDLLRAMIIELGKKKRQRPSRVISGLHWSLILALGVCYHASLQKKRKDFLVHISKHFQFPEKEKMLERLIEECQDLFMAEMKIEPNIARNQALKENVFMMIICIELRIPLFLVGKPGSSKSLAKTIVLDNMTGAASHSRLFKELKQVNMISYQCSPHATSEGIVGIFDQCAQLQKAKWKELEKYVAVVVLDEVGLAEDSPQMPLKALHPLLEDGTQVDEAAHPYKKVGFIGISNWSLDPAKMNRGILVQRGAPDIEELHGTARDICKSDDNVSKYVEPIMRPLAQAYNNLYDQAIKIEREFFGLRDFYSLVKMVYRFADTHRSAPTWDELEHAIRRNFGGLEKSRPVRIFRKFLLHEKTARKPKEQVTIHPNNTPGGLLEASLCGEGPFKEGRYLLLLTENYAALPILQQNYSKMQDATVIFGSSFPKDLSYTMVCRNINRIKICMETGQTVILLNLENLYESLYDVLNQYYTRLGGKRHVDLGLGTHRVKSCVHEDFRLVVVAEKEHVYKRFPIPLINRLEKHFVAMSTILSSDQRTIAKDIEEWADSFCNIREARIMTERHMPSLSDLFIGYHQDSPASIVTRVSTSEVMDDDKKKEAFQGAQIRLLECATPEAAVRMGNSVLANGRSVLDAYFLDGQHESLMEYIRLQVMRCTDDSFTQITTHSVILGNKALKEMSTRIQKESNLTLKSYLLQTFHTEQQFSTAIGKFFRGDSDKNEVLIIQCDSGDLNTELIACARYLIYDEYKQACLAAGEGARLAALRHIILIIKLPRVRGGCFSGVEGGKWRAMHLDDLQEQHHIIPPIHALRSCTLAQMVDASVNAPKTPGAAPVQGGAAQAPVPAPRGGRAAMAVTERPAAKVGPDGGGDLRIDLDYLIFRSIHRAAHAIRNESDIKSSTERIKQMKQLLNPGSRMLQLVKGRICLLMRERETEVLGEDIARSWLLKEVASIKAISKAGTFRRSLWMYLEATMTPLLAGAIAYADTNNNLKLITNLDTDRWKLDLWYGIFSLHEFTKLSYEDLQLLTAQGGGGAAGNSPAMVVKMTGANGTCMTGDFPFSWIIKEYIDNLIDMSAQADYVAQGNMEMVKKVVARLGTTRPDLVTILQRAADAGRTDALTESYLNDYVRMTYHAKTQDTALEYELVKTAIQTGMTALGADDNLPSYEHIMGQEMAFILSMVHVAERRIHNRLLLFSQVIQCHRDIVKNVVVFLETDTDSPMTTKTEMTLDVLTIDQVVKAIKPDKGLLRNEEQNRNWLSQVEKLAPLIDDVLARSDDIQESGEFGLICLQELEYIRLTWRRIRAVKLFADIVCPKGSNQESNITKMCPKLWEKVADANFKKVETLDVIEDFSKFVTRMACTQGARMLRLCDHCQNILLKTVQLPCAHSVCAKCNEQLMVVNDFKCLQCGKPYKPDAKLDYKEENPETIQEVARFKARCEMFYMEIVKRMCLEGSQAPEEGIVARLMEYITTDKEEVDALPGQQANTAWKIFKQGDKPNPVIRSVLLQLLIGSSLDSVRSHMDNYLRRVKGFTKGSEDLKLALIYVQCLEDHYEHSLLDQDGDHKRSIKNATDLLGQAIRPLDQANQGDDEEQVSLAYTLEAVAKARFGLGVTAKMLLQLHVEKSAEIDQEMLQRLCKKAEVMCNMQTGSVEMRSYLMRLIVRGHGQQALQIISGLKHLRWVIPDFARTEDEMDQTDRFLICGESYQETRNIVQRCVIEENMNLLNNLLGQCKDVRRSRMLVLSLYRMVMSTYQNKDKRKHPLLKVVEKMCASVRACDNFPFKEEAILVLTNKVAEKCPQLKVTPQMPPARVALRDIVIHFLLAVTSLPAQGIMAPVIALVRNPASCKNQFLPTMPQDNREAIFGVIQQEKGWENWGKPKFYECPNGHPYMIGNCGRAVQDRPCPSCGAKIGGVEYDVLAPGNKNLLELKDTTKCGHALGDVVNRSVVAETERDLSPLSNALLRLVLHLALYTGANKHLKEVSALITPVVKPDTTPEFLYQHMIRDMQVIQNASGKSSDDSALLVHLLIENLSKKVKADAKSNWKSKDGRQSWEKEFSMGYIAPLTKNLNGNLHEANEKVTNDKGGGSLLLRLTHETGDAAPITPDTKIQDISAMWRYRSHITLEHLTKELDENVTPVQPGGKKPFSVLKMFLKMEPTLRVVQLLPNIIRLVQAASRRYHRKLTRNQAKQMKIVEFLSSFTSATQKSEVYSWFKDLCTAWTSVHTQLLTFRVSDKVLPEMYCNSIISEESPLSTLLPSDRGSGLCVTALLTYLSRTHNEFMQHFQQLSGTPEGPEVALPNVNSTHMVTYDPGRDLLPLVSANCSYSLEVGQGTRIDYDLPGLETQLTEKFIAGRAQIIFQLDSVVYCEDANNATLFEKLEKKIAQQPLAPALQTHIRNDLRHVIEASDFLSNLDIVIGFLVMVGGAQHTFLHEFVTKVLEMDDAFLLPKAKQLCRLHHTKALWLLVSLELEKMAAKYKQEPFTSVDVTEYRVELKKEQVVELDKALRHMPVDYLLAELYECIVLRITIKRNIDDEDYVDYKPMKLSDMLVAHIEEKGGTPIPSLSNATFPNSITVAHCVEAWLAIFTFISKQAPVK